MPAHRTASSREGGHLRVTLLVTLPPDANCSVLDSGPSGTVSMHEAPKPGGPRGGDRTCAAEVTADGDGAPRLLEGNVTDNCVCPVFSERECIASIEGFEGRTLVVSVAVSDREELSSVVAGLRDRGSTVRLKRISTPSVDTGRRMLELDADAVTDKQRQAVRAAIEAGYYETPREADLADLADALEVSKSAVSQRLTAVESKLVAELVEAEDGPRPAVFD